MAKVYTQKSLYEEFKDEINKDTPDTDKLKYCAEHFSEKDMKKNPLSSFCLKLVCRYSYTLSDILISNNVEILDIIIRKSSEKQIMDYLLKCEDPIAVREIIKNIPNINYVYSDGKTLLHHCIMAKINLVDLRCFDYRFGLLFHNISQKLCFLLEREDIDLMTKDPDGITIYNYLLECDRLESKPIVSRQIFETTPVYN